MTDTQAGPSSLSRRIDRLFASIRRRDGSEYPYQEVADAIAAAGEGRVSANFIRLLRTQPATPSSLSRRIDRLFASIRRPDGSEYPYQEVARALKAHRADWSVSGHRLAELRKGRPGKGARVQKGPSLVTLRALAWFFEVPVAYLVEEDEGATIALAPLARFFGVPTDYLLGDEEAAAGIDAQLRVLAALDQGDIRELALRMGETSKALEAVADLLEQATQPPRKPEEPPPPGI